MSGNTSCAIMRACGADSGVEYGGICLNLLRSEYVLKDERVVR